MKLTKLLLVLTAFGALTIASDTGALAASPQTANFNVTASVIQNCSITAGNVAFGNYDPLSTTDLVADGQVTITCTNGASVNIALSGGAHLAAPWNQMFSATATAPNNLLQYKLFQTAGSPPTVQWNDSPGSGSIMSITVATLSPVLYPIHGLVRAGQSAAVANNYTDTVTATVNF
jgi:spore coat protein U-like protein